MKVAKISNNNYKEVENNLIDIDSDLIQLFSALQGRIRFGDGATGARGENISGEFVQFTSDASADTEFSVSHTVGSVPIGSIILWQDKAGSLYQGPSTGTSWTSSNVYFKSSGTSVTYLVFLLK